MHRRRQADTSPVLSVRRGVCKCLGSGSALSFISSLLPGIPLCLPNSFHVFFFTPEPAPSKVQGLRSSSLCPNSFFTLTFLLVSVENRRKTMETLRKLAKVKKYHSHSSLILNYLARSRCHYPKNTFFQKHVCIKH